MGRSGPSLSAGPYCRPALRMITARQPKLGRVIRPDRWADTYGDRGATALAYGMNEDFSRVLQKQMDAASKQTDASMERVNRVTGEIEEVRQVMVENIDRCARAWRRSRRVDDPDPACDRRTAIAVPPDPRLGVRRLLNRGKKILLPDHQAQPHRCYTPVPTTAPSRPTRVLERGEKIELLVDKAENLNQQAFKFRKQSSALKRAMWIKNLKLYALVAFMLGVRAP